MQFSARGSYISGGAVEMHTDAGPMDGRWRINWESGSNAETYIVGGAWRLFGISYKLDLSQPGRAEFRCE